MSQIFRDSFRLSTKSVQVSKLSKSFIPRARHAPKSNGTFVEIINSKKATRCCRKTGEIKWVDRQLVNVRGAKSERWSHSQRISIAQVAITDRASMHSTSPFRNGRLMPSPKNRSIKNLHPNQSTKRFKRSPYNQEQESKRRFKK